MYSDILNEIQTKEQADKLVNEFEQLNRRIFNLNENIGQIIDQSVSLNIGSELKKLSEKNHIDLADRRKLKEYINQLIIQIRNLGILKLTIACPPTEEIIGSITNWIKKNVKQKIILDIKIDTSITAGLIAEYQGIYKDLSLYHLVEKTFESKKDLIEKMIG